MTIDIDKMFKEAAGAAEETGEENPAKFGSDDVQEQEAVEAREQEVVETNEQPEMQQPEPQPAPQPTPKPTPKPTPQPKPQPKPQPAPQRQQRPQQPTPNPSPQRPARSAPQPMQTPKPAGSVDLNVDTVTRVLKMNSMLAKIDDNERKFIVNYFAKDSENPLAETIYNAFIVEKQDIEALEKVVVSRGHSAADRAFFLIGLPNHVIQTIFEQVDRLNRGSESSDLPVVNDTNKIEACRTLEGAISRMDETMISHINKLIEFASLANLDK